MMTPPRRPDRPRPPSPRYDTDEITDGVTEVIAYGTAVYVEKV